MLLLILFSLLCTCHHSCALQLRFLPSRSKVVASLCSGSILLGVCINPQGSRADIRGMSVSAVSGMTGMTDIAQAAQRIGSVLPGLGPADVYYPKEFEGECVCVDGWCRRWRECRDCRVCGIYYPSEFEGEF